MQKELTVEGMTCNHCKSAVEGALAEESGVTTATADIDAGLVNVNYDDSKVSLDKIKEVIEDQGYDVK